VAHIANAKPHETLPPSFHLWPFGPGVRGGQNTDKRLGSFKQQEATTDSSPTAMRFPPAQPVAPSRGKVGSLAVLFSVIGALSFGCGYRVAGRGDRLPPDVKTIAVPIFVNQSSRFRIEQRLAQAVTREFIERTQYRITPEPSQADAVLKGTVKDVRAGVVTFDLQTGRATALQIQVTADVQLVDLHTKKALFANPNYIFREEYQVSQSPANLFEEDQPALDRLSRDLARTLVTEILENF